MKTINAFIGKSFQADDKETVRKITDYLHTFRHLGFFCEDALEDESIYTHDKVKDKFKNKQVFIGIFSRRNSLQSHRVKKLNPKKSPPKLPDISKHDLWTTSGWTLQESGFAIAQNMQLVFLVEEGVFDLGGLHGNLNYIPFSRANLEECFPRINSMVLQIIANENSSGDTGVNESQAAPPVSKKEQPASERGERVHEIEIMIALSDKDDAKADTEYKTWLEKAESDLQRNDRATLFQVERLWFGRSDAFEKLEAISKLNPNHYLSKFHLASEFEKIGHYSEAIKLFTEAAGLASSAQSKITCLVNSALNIFKSGKLDESIGRLEELLGTNLDSKLQTAIFEALADIYKECKNDHKEIACLERGVYLTPSNHALRFRLAYKYSEIKNDAQALFHYEILSRQAPDETNLNNLGVAYNRLSMGAKAIEAYEKSVSLNGTLAIANMVQKLVQAGFLNKAKEYINKAREIKDYHPNITDAEASITKKQEVENKKREEVLKGTSDEREFRVNFAEALSKSCSLIDLTGKWGVSHHGELNFQQHKNLVSSKKRYLVPNSPYMAALYVGLLTPTPKFKVLSLETVLHNSTLTGTLILQDEDEKEVPRTLFGSSKIEHQMLGIIINDSLIKVMQIKNENEIEFYEMKKIESKLLGLPSNQE